MQRLGASTILRPATGAVSNQEFRDLPSKGGSGHVESRVACIEVVSNLGVEEVRGRVACRADTGRRSRKSGTASQTPGYLFGVAGHDDADEFLKTGGRGWRRFHV
jgi:hypothetical protein